MSGTGKMNNSLEHLERGYFDCFHETVKATREVLADINEIDATYINMVLTVMAKWQKDVTLAIADMYTVVSSVQPLTKLTKKLWWQATRRIL